MWLAGCVQSWLQAGGGVVGTDDGSRLGEDGAGVHALIHTHNGAARDGVTGEDGRSDR